MIDVNHFALRIDRDRIASIAVLDGIGDDVMQKLAQAERIRSHPHRLFDSVV